MLEGVVPFPPEFAARYRERGYWQDKSLSQEFAAVFERFAERIALIDGDRAITYAELDRLSANLALNLLELGLEAARPRGGAASECRRVRHSLSRRSRRSAAFRSPRCPAIAIPRSASSSSYPEPTACVTPDRQKDFDYLDMVGRIRRETPALSHAIVWGCSARKFRRRSMN